MNADLLNLRVLDGQAASPHPAVFRRMADEWCRDVGVRIDACRGVFGDQRATRLHELRSLSHVVGARAVSARAAAIEQAVERGEAPTDADYLELHALAEMSRAALAAWWTKHSTASEGPA